MTRHLAAIALLLPLTAACTGLRAPAPSVGAEEPVAAPAAPPAEAATPGAEGAEAPALEIVTLPSPGSPLVAVRLLFRAGSIHDPAGKEGLAALTGLMLGEAGTQKRTYTELVESLYPMAASIEVMTDREVTVLSGEVHRETLTEYTALLLEAVLEPAFAEKDFSRNKQQLVSYLENTLRASNDELLGLEAIQQAIFSGHPYGHAPAGTIAGLEAITLDDVKAFYRQHFTRAALMLGIAGGYPEGYVDELAAELARLPAGDGSTLELPQPAEITGRNFLLVEKPTSSVGIHFGYPLPITRADTDYYPLMVANSFLGEHRTFHGRLMQQLRGKRGLNYGDYSYIEHWHLPPFTTTPTPNVPRRQQFFSVWIRPVVPATAHFALRNALYEVDRLVEQGMSAEEFELTRSFLVNYSKLWAQTLSDRLGFLMDSRFYGMEAYIEEIEERLAALSVDDVNRAIRAYISTADFVAVLVTDKAAEVEAYLEAEEPSPMTYNAEPEAAVKEADATIEALPVTPESIAIVPVDRMFAGDG